MSPGTVALAYLPQADRKTKLRPVLVLCEVSCRSTVTFWSAESRRNCGIVFPDSTM